ncbi:MAG: polynucleotide adenylyltransferase PcnB [Thiotrichales bacterium]|nr:polynucleotide adenylyltransferase PcnB [Thiotrichales bacterium]
MSQDPQNTIRRLPVEPRKIPRAEHTISRSEISENALKVLYRLMNAGYQACLVGGGVRDLLLGRKPKDFDVVTDAHPEQIRELFRNCRLIGRRFRLAHVRFGNEIIEVSTFRACHSGAGQDAESEAGRILRDNVYGDIDDDVWRRDFTVNALYYDIGDFSIIDYVGGMRDIEQRQLRLIGQPRERYREDPVRMLRAIRFAAKLDFTIHAETEQPITRLAPLLRDIPPARLHEEFLKLFLGGAAGRSFELLSQYGLFEHLFEQMAEMLAESDHFRALLTEAFRNTDRRIAEELPVTPGFLVAAILWAPVRRLADEHEKHGLPEMEALHLAGDAVISRQVRQVAMPRRVTLMAREIWMLQSRLKRRQGKRPIRLLGHPRFRAGYDFLLLRAQSGEPVTELVDWWKQLQIDHPEVMASPGRQRGHGQKRRYRRRPGKAGH